MSRSISYMLAASATLLSMCHALAFAADEKWPKEFQALQTNGCIAQMIAGQDLSTSARNAIEKTCECMTAGYQDVISFEAFNNSANLSPAETQAMPEYAAMRAVSIQCHEKHHSE